MIGYFFLLLVQNGVYLANLWSYRTAYTHNDGIDAVALQWPL